MKNFANPRNIIFSLTIILLSITAKADIPDIYYVHVQITLKNSDTIDCYFQRAEYYLKKDSIQNGSHLFKSLIYDPDTAFAYTDIIRINDYGIIDPPAKTTFIKLRGKISFAVNDIESITYLGHDELYAYFNILSDHSPSDSIWYNNKPIQTTQISAYICDYWIMAYEDNSEINHILDQIGDKLLEIKELQQSDINTETYDKLAKKDDAIGMQLAEKLNKYKVAILTGCWE